MQDTSFKTKERIDHFDALKQFDKRSPSKVYRRYQMANGIINKYICIISLACACNIVEHRVLAMRMLSLRGLGYNTLWRPFVVTVVVVVVCLGFFVFVFVFGSNIFLFPIGQ